MKRALITGITGQDGSYLAELLLSKGYEVHGMVRPSTVKNYRNIEHIKDRLHLHEGDMTDSESITNIVFKTVPHEVYNLAAQSHVGSSFDLPTYTADVVALGTLRLLEAVRALDMNIKVYQASTSEMFGPTLSATQNENTPFQPNSPYAIAKTYAHQMCKLYRNSYDMFICSGILFNHESPRRGEDFVTKKICKAVAEIAYGKRDRLELGNLEAMRDWGYAPEYVEAMWQMLQYAHPYDYVIGTGETHTVREFMEYAFGYLGIDPSKHVSSSERTLIRPAEVPILCADSTRAHIVLGWKPKVKFHELIRIMVDHERDKYV